MKHFFVTATHTDAGKTFISALIVKALDAKYWKPIQAGSLETDTQKIQEIAQVPVNRCFAETYLLQSPESPHSAAKKEGVEIELAKIILPKTHRNLIVEGAGGVLVPINDSQTMLDVMEHLALPIILVVPTYLGCINHALLSIEVLKARSLSPKYLIFNGKESTEAQKIIVEKAGNPMHIRIPRLDFLSVEAISEQSLRLQHFLE